MSVSAKVHLCEQAHLPWTHLYGKHLIFHNKYQEGATDEDNKDNQEEDENVDDDEDEKVTVTDKDNHNKPKVQNCQHCNNYVSHLHASNGIPGSFC